MVLGLKKTDKAPPKVVLRNQAVQAVGEKYFQVALVGLLAAGVLAIVAIAIGEVSERGFNLCPQIERGGNTETRSIHTVGGGASATSIVNAKNSATTFSMKNVSFGLLCITVLLGVLDS